MSRGDIYSNQSSKEQVPLHNEPGHLLSTPSHHHMAHHHWKNHNTSHSASHQDSGNETIDSVLRDLNSTPSTEISPLQAAAWDLHDREAKLGPKGVAALTHFKGFTDAEEKMLAKAGFPLSPIIGLDYEGHATVLDPSSIGDKSRPNGQLQWVGAGRDASGNAYNERVTTDSNGTVISQHQIFENGQGTFAVNSGTADGTNITQNIKSITKEPHGDQTDISIETSDGKTISLAVDKSGKEVLPQSFGSTDAVNKPTKLGNMRVADDMSTPTRVGNTTITNGTMSGMDGPVAYDRVDVTDASGKLQERKWMIRSGIAEVEGQNGEPITGFSSIDEKYDPVSGKWSTAFYRGETVVKDSSGKDCSFTTDHHWSST